MSRIPMLVSGCDLKSLPLSPADAFLLSRVDGTLTEHDLAVITGLCPERVAATLDRLAALGAVDLMGAGSHTRLRAASVPPVEPRRTPAEPDTLAARRQAFARRLAPTPVTPARRPTAPDPAHVRRAAEALHIARERAITEARRSEIVRLLDEGTSALARRDFASAIDAHRLAAALAPEDPALQATCDEAVRRARIAFADELWARALLDEREERWEEAALGFARVCAARPTDARAHERVANAAMRSGNQRRAVEYARKAIELAPASAGFRVTLARAYASAGFETSARCELERAIELAPEDARIKSLVARVGDLLSRRRSAAT